MKILVIGSGGREHAIGRKLADSPRRPELHFAPGNPGMAPLGALHAVASDDLSGLVALAGSLKADLVVVGPEQPLALGLVDRLQEAGIAAFGPTAKAARLESSKAFSKALMARHGIPTAGFSTFTELAPLLAHLESCPVPVVVKASGLAAGKGAIVCLTREEALQAAESMLGETREFGEAGSEVVVEEFMQGEEASVFAICDGDHYVVLPSAQDHKRIFDGDQGPNTGGMGAYAPAPVVTPTLLATVCHTIIEPTLKAMDLEGCPFQGVLYVGLMITKNGPKVVEYNCRFGDPETQVVLPVLEADLLDLVEAAVAGKLGECHIPAPRRSAAVVVLAAEGYPGPVAKGREIHGIAEAEAIEGVRVYHAGTALAPEGTLVTSGGRVLGVTGMGDTLSQAVETAYRGVSAVGFQGVQFRRDIAARGLQAEAKSEPGGAR